MEDRRKVMVMRVLWVCNIMPPLIGAYLGKECSVKEGWISGCLARLIQENGEVELAVCYPVLTKEEEEKKEVKIRENKNITCYGFVEDTIHPEKYGGLALERRMEEILQDFSPQILHIFGTEYGHALAAAKAGKNPKRTLVGLQGVISACAREYMADLPPEVQKKVTFRDFVKQDSMLQQQKKFYLRGEREKETIKACGNVTGRTLFDQRQAYAINPKAVYYSMNETMRSEFYEGRWSLEKCKKHSIFFSQADYPLKGLHYLLQALRFLKEKYPDVTVSVAGNSLVQASTLRDRIKRCAYGNYLSKLMKEEKLTENLSFLGNLSALEMKQQYLKCHTFVCASSLENSPNSVAEAMLLGVPVVASDTGGIPSMLRQEKEGLLFEKGNSKALALAIMKTWEEKEETLERTENARQRAFKTHDPDTNYKRLLEIYHCMEEEA